MGICDEGSHAPFSICVTEWKPTFEVSQAWDYSLNLLILVKDWQNFTQRDINLFAGVVMTSTVDRRWLLLVCYGLSDKLYPEMKSQLNGGVKALVGGQWMAWERADKWHEGFQEAEKLLTKDPEVITYWNQNVNNLKLVWNQELPIVATCSPNGIPKCQQEVPKVSDSQHCL